ncbi:conserved membrane hypothetical protein [uncultured Paludibacter sp.]|uniref:Polysaccharide biosynthesis protein n=1 Tax=uncultured Paludibacter sp. TaxID=497635 RepID=A0A653A5H1_9BACT|nr:conserved membrane hypothetical protein [uncultured Paludibacter sp.]
MEFLKKINNKKTKIKNVSQDILLNVVANMIPVIILQFLIQPIVANKLGAERNGLFITIIALLRFTVVITGSSLNNTRLLLDKMYKNNNFVGDFNLYLLVLSVVNIFIVAVGLILYGKSISAIEIFIICILSLLWMIKDYLIVEYRIILNYKKILINNLLLSLGLVLGLLVFIYLPYWHVIFIVGYLISFLHVFWTTKLIKEPFVKTSMFAILNKTILVIIFANFLAMLSANFDRLVLYPLVGGTLVSIYYSASAMGKMMTLLSSPLSSVFLSYVVKYELLPMKWFNYIVGISIFLGIILYIIFILVSPILLNVLYPKWSNESIRYVPIVTAIAIFELVVTVINPIVMRFCKINYQIKIQLLFLLSYMVLGLSLLKVFGMIGFAYGVLIATFIKVLYVYFNARSVLLKINNRG